MNTKITFFSLIEKRYFYGFEKKISSIIKCFSELGYESNYVNFSDLSIKGVFKLVSELKRSQSTIKIVRMIGIKSFILLFLLVFTNKKVFIEVPTSFNTVNKEFIISKSKNLINYIYFILNYSLTPFLLIFFKKIIYYHEEKFPYNLFLKNKIIYWENGIDVEKTFFKKSISTIINNKINFIFIGSLGKWHGLERIILSIIHFQKNNNEYKFTLNIVGFVDEQSIIEFRSYSAFFSNGNVLEFHGLKKNNELFEIIKESHIALGSLGLKKIDNFQRSELKIREYTAFGIPFLMEAVDKDYFDQLEFIFKINRNEDIIDIDSVIKWFINLDNNVCIKMRDFANKKLDYKIKIKKLINEIN